MFRYFSQISFLLLTFIPVMENNLLPKVSLSIKLTFFYTKFFTMGILTTILVARVRSSGVVPLGFECCSDAHPAQ